MSGWQFAVFLFVLMTVGVAAGWLVLVGVATLLWCWPVPTLLVGLALLVGTCCQRRWR